nr:2-amino-4-hydroxy-6-hydroxymethyldihydropteridine diphosphokinase [Effusibacillus pohliae]
MGQRNPDTGMHEAFLGLGSNLGDRERYLADAICSLQQKGIRMLAQSPVYETKAVGYVDQPDFLNMVVRVQTELPPHELLRLMLAVERQCGRRRDVKWGPRTLDLDLLFYDNLVLDGCDLAVPHPRLEERAFVLLPLCDLAPDWVHPVSGLTVREMAEQVPGKGGVRRWERPLANGCGPTEN